MFICIPYTYLIGWSKHDKYYYGVQYGKKANPSNLWTKYFTSSEKVDNLRQELGEPDIIEVRRTFDTPEKAILWETRVLTKLDVLYKDKWLNGNIAGAIPMNEEIKHKISESLKGIKRSNAFKEKVSQFHKGKIVSDETREKLRVYKGELSSFYDKHHSEETKLKISLKNSGNNKEVHICPHCGKEGKGSIMFRHHFDRCKNKPL